MRERQASRFQGTENLYGCRRAFRREQSMFQHALEGHECNVGRAVRQTVQCAKAVERLNDRKVGLVLHAAAAKHPTGCGEGALKDLDPCSIGTGPHRLAQGSQGIHSRVAAIQIADVHVFAQPRR